MPSNDPREVPLVLLSHITLRRSVADIASRLLEDPNDLAELRRSKDIEVGAVNPNKMRVLGMSGDTRPCPMH